MYDTTARGRRATRLAPTVRESDTRARRVASQAEPPARLQLIRADGTAGPSRAIEAPAPALDVRDFGVWDLQAPMPALGLHAGDRIVAAPGGRIHLCRVWGAHVFPALQAAGVLASCDTAAR